MNNVRSAAEEVVIKELIYVWLYAEWVTAPHFVKNVNDFHYQIWYNAFIVESDKIGFMGIGIGGLSMVLRKKLWQKKITNNYANNCNQL